MTSFADFADGFIGAARAVTDRADLVALVEGAANEMGFRYYALAHHDDLRTARSDRVSILSYPDATLDRLVAQRCYRRDPIVRGCIFADSAFLWSQLHYLIRLDKRDRDAFDLGAREGLNEGITIPYVRLGDCIGSCTLAGLRRPERASRFLGLAQMIGIFGFQAARRLLEHAAEPPRQPPRLQPRPRDCVVLAGRGYSNKEIARALAITPRTVDGYMTEARRIFRVQDRTELVIGAVLAGEVGIHELKQDQPE